VTTAASQIRPSSSASSPERGKDIIRFSGVRKAFGPQVVLDGLDLAFTEGKTTVVLGPSGSGKSVMLKHIVGLLRPDLGRVDFDGTRIDTLDEEALIPFRLQIGFLFQMAALFDSMTVEENISFPLVEHTRLTAAQRRDRVRDALKVVDLEGVERKLPSQLSGGQRKRVGLARAIVTEPRVVLYDEPTTGLDPIRSDGINELILKLRRTLGVTGIVDTHDLTSARKVADRVVMLLNGRIAADGTFAQLESSPDPRVQHFLAGQYSREDDDALSKDAPPDEEPAPGTPASPPTPPSGLTS
jgi:phospholipid/cholesterol/gamma-HCH transport system ATP-binding protein